MRSFSFGPRALPGLLDSDTLVTKRPTALGEDLCITRVAEWLAASEAFNDRLVIPGVGRATSGRMTAVFITQLTQDLQYRDWNASHCRGSWRLISPL